jgi:microcompartment protein CcmL/EutN
MGNNKAIGIIEIQNYTNGLVVCDIASKSGDLKLIHNKNNIGGRLVTLVFEGTVSAMQSAFDACKKHYENTKFLKVCEVVPNPTKEIMNYMYRGDFEDGSK